MKFWVLALVAMVGCSSSSPPTRSIPESFGPTSATAERHESTGEMLDLLGMGGDVASGGVGNNAGGLKDFVEIAVPGGVVDVYLFQDRKQMKAWLPQMLPEFQVVYGPNWIVTGPDIEAIFDALGGTVTADPGAL